MSLPTDLWIRHLVAQQSKAFFGHGPKGRTAVVVQGPVAVFTSDLAGPGMVSALMTEPFGRLCMRYINHLYVERNRAELEALAAASGVRLLAVGSDLDFSAGVSVGVAVARAALPGALPEAPDPDLASRLHATRAFVGPALVTAWLPEPLPAPEGTARWLQAWEDRSAAAAQALRGAVGQAGRGAFLIPAGDQCLAGTILRV